MSQELLPCPFCGSKPTITRYSKKCDIRCMNNACSTVVQVFGNTETDATERWNTRSQPAGVALTEEAKKWLNSHLTLLSSFGLTDPKEMALCLEVIAKLAGKE